VVIYRPDIRKKEGRPNTPIPGVGTFAVKNGKIIQRDD